MALVRHDTQEVQFKLVYCGPPEGGKTTNLHYIHRRLDSYLRGDLISVATDQNRTISFDFLPIHTTEIEGYQTRFQLYTVPGQDVLSETRKNVLAGADGVVFVADSTPSRLGANLSAFNNCREALRENRIDPDRLPISFQYNKRDRADATCPDLFDEMFGVRRASFLACATSGYQVFATLDDLTKQVIKGFHSQAVRKEGSIGGSRAKSGVPVSSEN
ncbi:MAG: GTPase domain-containing protein [Verrucomicrobiales bacterium]|nr:GTPase domain-containing protein [Verrucomicrobiales bacterium]